jgi:hypothetical protein
MAGLCAPLPTLRCCPREQPRTAQGRCGSLLRHRIGLAPTTHCRSPGALRKILYVIQILEAARLGCRMSKSAAFVNLNLPDPICAA